MCLVTNEYILLLNQVVVLKIIIGKHKNKCHYSHKSHPCNFYIFGALFQIFVPLLHHCFLDEGSTSHCWCVWFLYPTSSPHCPFHFSLFKMSIWEYYMPMVLVWSAFSFVILCSEGHTSHPLCDFCIWHDPQHCLIILYDTC